MATRTSQRIGISIILVALIVGTLGSFVVMILAQKNSKADEADRQAALVEYQKNQEEYQVKVDAQTAALSKKYYPTFKAYADAPAAFDRDSVKKLTKKDLKVGTGSTIDGATTFAAYYIGWNSDGKIFDQSIQDGALKAPYTIDGLDNTSIIEGWSEGLQGMKIGGIRELSIPSDKAYGETGGSDQKLIPPNAPLKFIVMAVPAPDVIAQPEIPTKLLGSYGS